MTDLRGRAAAGVASAGLGGAVCLVPTPVGVGPVLVGAMAVAGLVVAGRRVTASGLLPPLVLLGVGIFRAAEWVVLPSLGAAVLVASYQLSGSLRRAVFLAPVALLRLGRPFVARWPAQARVTPYVRGAVLGTMLVFVFGVLFVTADRAFAQIAADALVDVDGETVVLRLLAFVACSGLVGGLVLAEPRDEVVTSPERLVARAEWTIPLGLLIALFAAFCAVQVTVLFAGHAAVLEAAGVTYAEYAREGFFQLLAAAALTLAVVAAASRWARRDTARDELLLRVMLAALCILTLVVLASAFRRLALYEDAFGFTRMRLAAHTLMLWLGAIFVLILGHGLLRSQLLRPMLVWTSAVGMVVFAFLNPDALIARRNIDRFNATGDLDTVYLSTLSADAIPVLLSLPPEVRACVLDPIAARLGAPDPPVAFNFARARARDLLETAARAQKGDLICTPGRSDGVHGD